MFHFAKEPPSLTSDAIPHMKADEIETANLPIASEIDKSRRELLDLGSRNPLISYRTLRARGVEVVDADPAAVFNALVSNARRMSFAPLEEEEVPRELIRVGIRDQVDSKRLCCRHQSRRINFRSGCATRFILRTQLFKSRV